MKTFQSLLITLIVSFWYQNEVQATQEFAPTVQLTSGKVRGLVETLEQQKVYFYQAIRYGQSVRFSAPTPPTPWSDVYNATRTRFTCPQADYPPSDHLPENPTTRVSNEDCLYLNVWQPEMHRANRTVLVWIHGGGFFSGSITDSVYDGRYMALAEDVVVVSIQYRLGALGFLYGATRDAPGNLGLRDQIHALKWVQENIHAFTGDPAKVTLFGQSAGSMSIGALILSPMASSLFTRAIMQSGAPNSYLGSEDKEKSFNKSLSLGSKFNCPHDAASLVECLRSKTLKEILDSTNNAILNGESFLPIYGDAVLTHPPVVSLKRGMFNHKVDLLFGVTNGEGSNFVVPNLPMINSDTISVKMANKIIALMFQLFQVEYYQEVADFYTRHLNDSNKDALRQAVTNSFGDYHIVCPEVFFAEQMSREVHTARLYSYRLTQQFKNGCHGWMNVCHSEDDLYVFGRPLIEPRQFTSREQALSKEVVHAWTQFAKTGAPGAMGTIKWEPAFKSSHNQIESMNLHADAYRMEETRFYRSVCDSFWRAKIFT